MGYEFIHNLLLALPDRVYNKGGGFCSRGERIYIYKCILSDKSMKKEEPPAF